MLQAHLHCILNIKDIFKYQSRLTGLPPQQPCLEGARRIYCMLPRQRGMLLRHRSLSEPWQRNLPPCFLTFRYYSRVVRHDYDERLLLSAEFEHARLPKALGSLLIFFTLIMRSFFLLACRFARGFPDGDLSRKRKRSRFFPPRLVRI